MLDSPGCRDYLTKVAAADGSATTCTNDEPNRRTDEPTNRRADGQYPLRWRPDGFDRAIAIAKHLD
jgi:hypothetical protein